jgi:arylsulfatase A
VADDVGYGDLSSYGGKVSTPALDRLAREGLKFTDFHATPFCTPTRASLLTGRYNQRMPGLEWPLDVDSTEGIPAAEVTLAEMLAPEYPGRGIVGKWHLGRQPNFNPVNNGFTSFYGMLKGWGDYLTHKDGSGLVDWWNGLVHLTTIEHSTTAITREALKKINYNAKQNQPFFLYVSYQAVHIPYMAPGDPAGTDNPAHYGAIIQAMDQGIGQIMGRVRTLPGETLVLFLSDNGGDNSHNRPANNGPLRGSKGSVYEGGIRVPAIAWMPGRVPSGAVSREPAHVIDILPTVSAVTGTSLPARKLDGRSLYRCSRDTRSHPGGCSGHRAMLVRFGTFGGSWSLSAPPRRCMI